MRIDGIGSAGGIQAPMGAGMDAQSRDIQNQIKVKQEEIQRLSKDENMSLEEKMKKRQQLQQEIADLNNQLRQHQTELRQRDGRSEKDGGESMDDMLGGGKRAEASRGKKAKQGLSSESMQAMVYADTSMKMADVKGAVATEMKGIAGILESEIKQDKAAGINTEKKEAELADVTKKAEKAEASQIGELGEANKAMREAAKAERTKNDTGDGKEDKEKDGLMKEDEDGKAEAPGSEAAVNIDIRV